MSKTSYQDKKRQILIVDDVPENLHLLGKTLTAQGLEISFADNGFSALESVDVSLPDLILLDVSMPGMDGFEVARRLKENPKTAEIPIIFLTALNDIDSILKGFNSGGVDYITKPFKAKELIVRLKTHIELKEKKEKINALNEELTELNSELADQKYISELKNAELIQLNNQLTEQKHLVENRNEQLTQLNEQLAFQKHIIEQKNKDLTDSIVYAQFIQNTLLPSKEKLNSFFSESFVFSKAKAIVSGDFYYFEKVNDSIVVIAADCTGHGVPGSVLSFLGLTLLNQIINTNKQNDPSQTLNILDKQFSQMLANTGKEQMFTEGIDMAMCSIDINNNNLLYCGCKLPLYIVRDGKLIKIKGNLHTIGGLHSIHDKVYTNHPINLQKGDMIYLFSDGYADQFGDKLNRKFGTSQFQGLLNIISKFDAKDQLHIIESTLLKWMGRKEQIDDILVIGMRV